MRKDSSSIVERGLPARKAATARLRFPRTPLAPFVTAGGIALLLDHVTEYEVTGDELALTILRSTGLISRMDNPWREDPAGPGPDSRCTLHGAHSFSFAYCPLADDAVELAELYRHPFLTARGPRAPREQSCARTRGRCSKATRGVVLTALLPGQARIVNESPEPQTVRFAGTALDLRPWEIRTVTL